MGELLLELEADDEEEQGQHAILHPVGDIEANVGERHVDDELAQVLEGWADDRKISNEQSCSREAEHDDACDAVGVGPVRERFAKLRLASFLRLTTLARCASLSRCR